MSDNWGAEQQHMIEKRHEAAKGMVKGVSTKTLKQTDKQVRASTHRHSIVLMEHGT